MKNVVAGIREAEVTFVLTLPIKIGAKKEFNKFSRIKNLRKITKF
ncbi:hypothetical protein PRVXT_001222 [Proteinivorax tanatarense]|uniref:Uncharacterized protein n=1 Tax=Proteinivorax tanatarense TaxID=1260629 RepID=A0AAU7VPC9_9FIRM